MTTASGGIWASGDAYDPYVGRWSRLVARELLAWLEVPPGGHWLDVGCGTGALSGTILELASPAEVVGVDASPAFIAYARAHVTDDRARFEVGDARALPVADATFDAVVSGLMLNFVPDPALAAAEMTRATRPAGKLGLYVWDYAGGMAMMRRFWDAATALDPEAGECDEGRRFTSVCRPDALTDLFNSAGLRAVETRAIEIPTLFRDFDDFWGPFLGGQGPAASYAMSLSDDRREALRERLRSTLPVRDDGAIPLTARAWAVRGER